MATYIQGGAGRQVEQAPRPMKLRPFDLRVGEWIMAKAQLFLEGNVADVERLREKTARYKITHVSERVFCVDRYVLDYRTGEYIYSYPTTFMKKDFVMGDVFRLSEVPNVRPV